MNIVITERGLFSNDANNHPVSASTPVSKVSATPKVTDETSIIREAEKSFVATTTPAYNISISSMGKAAVMSMDSLKDSYKDYYDSLLTPANDSNKSADVTDETRGTLYDRVADDSEEATTYGVQDSNRLSDMTDEAIEETYEKADSKIMTAYDNEAVDEASPLLESEEDTVLSTQDVDGLSTVSEEAEPQGVMKNYEDELDNITGKDNDISYKDVDNKLLKDTQETAKRVQEDPVMKQAIAAYNYQMAFEFNTQLTQ